nr:hypothetical protein 1634Bnrm1_p089 [Cryptomonas sp.]
MIFLIQFLKKMPFSSKLIIKISKLTNCIISLFKNFKVFLSLYKLKKIQLTIILKNQLIEDTYLFTKNPFVMYIKQFPLRMVINNLEYSKLVTKYIIFILNYQFFFWKKGVF